MVDVNEFGLVFVLVFVDFMVVGDIVGFEFVVSYRIVGVPVHSKGWYVDLCGYVVVFKDDIGQFQVVVGVDLVFKCSVDVVCESVRCFIYVFLSRVVCARLVAGLGFVVLVVFIGVFLVFDDKFRGRVQIVVVGVGNQCFQVFGVARRILLIACCSVFVVVVVVVHEFVWCWVVWGEVGEVIV